MFVKIIHKIQQNYITNENICSVDETFLSKQFVLFLVINLKTRAILGFGLKKLQKTYKQA